MKVEATRLGYYNHERKKPGAVFHIERKHFSESWMKALDKKASPAKEKKSEPSPVVESFDNADVI